MHRKKLFALASIATIGLFTLFWTTATAEPPKEGSPAGQEMKLPPGWTEADMQACMAATTPGEMHKYLAETTGVWQGKSTMWMGPGGEPMKSECVSTIAPMFDGRFVKCELTGDMPGMGPYTGFGLYGFDNVTQKFQSTWVDNCSTVMMQGTGELSSDHKTMTWVYSYTCPITNKPVTLREIETTSGKDTKTLEVYGIDPKSGKEYKMMEIAFTRKPGSGGTAAVPTGR